MKRLLAIFAHPDDESFAAGGTLAKYADLGWQVDLVMATHGDAGHDATAEPDTTSTLGNKRQKELEKAGTILGLHSVTFFGYTDGGLSSLVPGDLEDAIYKKIEEYIPDIIMTWDTTGVTNHPDHIKMCYATTYAFQKYAAWIEEKLKNQPDVEQVLPKLYYACMPESLVAYLKKKKLMEAESFGRPWRGTDDKFITNVIDISDYKEQKKQALAAHKTQSDDMNKYLSWSPIFNHEYFILRMQGTTEVFMGKNDVVAHEL